MQTRMLKQITPRFFIVINLLIKVINLLIKIAIVWCFGLNDTVSFKDEQQFNTNQSIWTFIRMTVVGLDDEK